MFLISVIWDRVREDDKTFFCSDSLSLSLNVPVLLSLKQELYRLHTFWTNTMNEKKKKERRKGNWIKNFTRKTQRGNMVLLSQSPRRKGERK